MRAFVARVIVFVVVSLTTAFSVQAAETRAAGPFGDRSSARGITGAGPSRDVVLIGEGVAGTGVPWLEARGLGISGAAGSALLQRVSGAPSIDRGESDSTSLHAGSADVGVWLAVNDVTPTVSETIIRYLLVQNSGPDTANGLVVRVLSPNMTDAPQWTSTGTYDPTSGLWTIDTLATGDTAWLVSRLSMNAGTAESVLTTQAGVAALNKSDPNASNDSYSVDISVQKDGVRVVSGSYVGDGSAARAVTGVGFQPDLIIVKASSAAAIAVARIRSMPGDAAKELGAPTGLVTGRILSLDRDGFTVGANASVNQSGVTYYWTAFLETPGQMKVGYYTGTGTDNQNIVGLGFRPGYVMVMADTTNSAVQRYAAQAGDATVYFQGVGELTDRIQRFDPDGFQVGTSPQVNTAGVIYYCTAWSTVAAVTGDDSYNGNANDDRDLTRLGFRPHHLFVTRREAGTPTVMRNRSIPGDLTLPVTAAAGFSNGLQKLLTLGFQAGTDAAVNNPSNTYYVAGIRDVTGADIGIAAALSNPTPDEGDTLALTLTVTNYGFEDATAVQARDRLPSGLAYLSSGASQGSYDPVSGVWDVGALANGGIARLDLTAIVSAGAAGSTLWHSGSITSSAPTDLFADNAADSVALRVLAADLDLRLTADDLTPLQGEVVAFTVRVDNLGPDPATGVALLDSLPPGFVYQGSTPSQGSYNPGTSAWTVGSIPVGGSASLTVTAAAPATAGSSLRALARIIAADHGDPAPGNEADTIRLDVLPPGFRVVTGSYVGDGSAARAVTGVGFQPDLLIIKASSAAIAVARTKAMSGDAAKELGAPTAPVTGRILSLDRGGFTVGADSSVNQTGVSYYWTAFLETPGRMKVGSYSGDGVDDRSITGVGFRPGYVMVLGQNAHSAVQRYGAQTGDATLYFQGTGELSDRIQRLDPDGFQIGASNQVNAAAVLYHYVAWNAVSSLIGGGSYTGDGLDDRDLTLLGFRPHHLFVARRQTGAPTVMRNRSIPGDLTLPATAAVGFSNGLQKLQSRSFQVGTNATVNTPANTYYVAGFRDINGSDIGVASAVSNTTPDEGDTLALTLTVTNYGFENATGIRIRDRLPSGITYRSGSAGQGSYDPASGDWNVGALANGASASLNLTATVDTGVAGIVMWHSGSVTSSNTADLFADNAADSVAFHVPAADLELSHQADDLTPVEGEPVTFTVRIDNHGPDDATGIVVEAPLPAEITYQSSAASLGSYDQASGMWTVGTIPAGKSASLFLSGAPPVAPGSIAVADARINRLDQIDPAAANDADTTTIQVHRRGFLVVTGSYVGNGAAGRPITGLGFQPDLLILKGRNFAPPVARTKYMPTDAAKDLGAATSIAIGAILSLDGDGFTLGASSSVNQSGITYYWSAFLETAGQMKVGAYVGNGTDNRSISGVGFQPGYAMVLGAGASSAVQRFSGEAGDVSLPFQNGAEAVDRIQRFDTDGFQLGANAEVNAAGVTYYYVTWNASFDRAKTGLYLGNGTDNRLVSGIGIRPKYLMIKRLDSSTGVQRSASMAGDFTLPTGPGGSFTNAIQALAPDGFQLGTNVTVNSGSKIYFWLAFADVPTLDLGLSQTVSDSLPNEGDAIVYTLKLVNNGPEDATGVVVTDALPAGLTYQAHLPSLGAYDPATGVWTLGSVVNGDSATLALTASVNAGTGGATLAHTASIAALDQTDSDDSNNQATSTLRVQSAELRLRVGVDRQSPSELDVVAFTVSVKNSGPDSATTVSVLDLLPAGLSYQADVPDRGAYDAPSGTWNIGALAVGDSVALRIDAQVQSGTGGTTLTNHAGIASADQSDPATGNESDSISVFVAQAPGIQLTAVQDSSRGRPGESQVRLFTLTILNSSSQARVLEKLVLTNRSSGAGSAGQLDAELGTLNLLRDDGDGSFDPGSDSLLRASPALSGAVAFDSLGVNVSSGSLVQLHVALDVPIGARDGDTLDVTIPDAGGVSFDQNVTLLNAWPMDPPGYVAVDGMSRAQLEVTSPPGTSVIVGTQRNLVLDVVIPPNGYQPDILNGIRLANSGTALPGADIARIDLWGDGSDGAFNAGAPDDFPLGTAGWDGSGWSLTGLSIPIPLEGRRIFASVNVSTTATVGRTIAFSLGGPGRPGFEVASENDGPVDLAVTSGVPIKIAPGPSLVTLTASQSGRLLLPGAAAGEMLRLRLVNRAAQPETLSALTFANETIGPGTAAQLDADWKPLTLVVEGQPVATTSFASGRAAFAGLAVLLAPGDTLTGTIESGASLAARDGDFLDLSIATALDVGFTRPVQLGATWPVDPAGTFPVDGMSAAQVGVGHRVSPQVLTGSTRNLALEVVVPANGYEPDALEFLLVRNIGNATPGVDITRVEAWADDGDGVFEPGAAATDDRPLGVMGLTGGVWGLGKFSAAIPAGGLRVYFSCDIAGDAIENRTVRLVLPYSPIAGIGVASGNDGPRDMAIENPVAMTISTNDRVTVTTQGIPSGTVAPGDAGVELLHLIVGNSYPDSTKTLTALTVSNLTSGAGGTQIQLDQEIQSLELRMGNVSGALLGRSFFSGGRATFSGLSIAIAPQQSRELFVVAEISTHAATDGDLVRAQVADEGALLFAEATHLAARFPLLSGSWRIDGMTAEQITTAATPDTTVGPGEGPVLALDWTVPRNGYADDVLEAVRLVNSGTAGAADLTDLHLWKDGGNGLFDAGAGDDQDLGSLVFASGRWSSQALAEPIGSPGVRLFAAVVSSLDPTDSASVQLAIPVNGIGVASGNDGPRDQAVPHANTILFSRSRLLATVEVSPGASVIGDAITARMTVRNTGDLGIYGVVPSDLEKTGNGAIVPIGGVTPPFLNLEPDSSGVFTWTYRADSAGSVFLTGSATGTELQTGFVHQSLTVTAAGHRIYAPAQAIDLYPVESMPFSVNRGQTQVVPISLTLSHPGTSEVSDVLLQRLTIRLEDELGNDVTPSSLLSHVALNEGATIFSELTTLPATGASFDLVLANPLRLVSGGTTASQVTLSLSLDISDTTRVSSFRISIPDSSSLATVDATNGAGVVARLPGSQSYPVLSGVARVVAGGTLLSVDGVPDTARTAGRGQDDIDLLRLTVDNPGPTTLGPNVRLSEFEVTLVDSTGALLGRPFDVFRHIRVTGGASPLLDRDLTEADSNSIVIRLSPLLTVPINTPTPIRIAADVAGAATIGTVRLRISRPESFVVRNASTGESLPAVFTTQPIDGPLVTIEAVAESLAAARTAAPSATISIGATDVTALTLTLSHPQAAGTASILCESVVIRCRDQQGRPVAPATLVDRAQFMIGGTTAGTVTDAGSSPSGEFTIPLQDVVLAAGQRISLELRWSVEASAFAGFYELSIGSDGILASDRNLGTPVTVVADSGAEFPLSSGLFELFAPARELVAGFRDAMPAALVADGRAVPVGRLSLRNRAPAGEIRVDRLSWVAADPGFRPLALGSVVSRVEAYVMDTLWAAVDVSPDSTAATVVGSSILSLSPGPATEIEIRIVPREEAAGTPFRLGCHRDGIFVIQPASPLLRVSVINDEGQVFPFWTEIGSLNPRSLKATYSNFPNPFAAGRQSTTFVYYLPSDARVSLSIWTGVGDKVATLLSGSSRSAGLHQVDRWDGRNGTGRAVMSGVYVAELVVQYADGSSERILRKVAVAR